MSVLVDEESELSILFSIYPELTIKNDRSAIIDVNVTLAKPTEITFEAHEPLTLTHLPPLTLAITLPKEYPESQPPEVSIQCMWLEEDAIGKIIDLLLHQFEPGAEMLYIMIDTLQSMTHDGFGVPLKFPATYGPVFAEFQQQALIREFNKKSFSCGICIDVKRGDQCHEIPLCKHIFCSRCLHDFFSHSIAEGSVVNIKCPDPSCAKSHVPIPLTLLAEIVTQEEVSRYTQLKEKQELESNPSSTYCPRPSCGKVLARDPDEKLVICTNCSYAFCGNCRKSWHGPAEPCKRLTLSTALSDLYVSSVGQEKSLLERQYGRKNLLKLVAEVEGDRLAGKWMQDNAQQCPVCQSWVEKSMGCNHITCGVCRNHFCFLCGDALSARNPYVHYNTKGSGCYQKLFMGLTGLEDDFPEFT